MLLGHDRYYGSGMGSLIDCMLSEHERYSGLGIDG